MVGIAFGIVTPGHMSGVAAEIGGVLNVKFR